MEFFKKLKQSSGEEWAAYTEHQFTEGLADGSLPQAAFKEYLVQDYLFLIEFARAYAVAVYKSPTLADMREAAGGISAILDVEMGLHVKLCAEWGKGVLFSPVLQLALLLETAETFADIVTVFGIDAYGVATNNARSNNFRIAFICNIASFAL